MLKKYIMGFVLRSPDANTDGGSSPSSDDNGADSSQQEQDGQESSQEEEGQEHAEDSSAEGTGEEQTDDQQNSQEQETQQQEEQSSNVAVDKEGDEKLPFHKHQRFQELVSEKNDWKQKVEAQKPLVDQSTALNDILRQNGISNQEYNSAIQFMVALRNNPQAAFQMIKPTYDRLAQFTGSVLPADLEAEVAAGTLSRERATQIAQAQAQQDYGKMQQQWQQYNQQNNTQDIVRGAIDLWVQNKVQNEADFKPGSPLFQQTDTILKTMMPATNAQEAMQNCDKALTQAKQFLAQFQPRAQQRANRPNPRSSQSATNGMVIDTSKGVDAASKQIIGMISSGVRPNQVSYR